MKKTCLALALCLAAGSASAANPHTSDVLCLKLAQIAAAIADSKQAGMKEADISAILLPTMAGNQQATYSTGIVISYVYTMSHKPADARQVVYLKCKAGDYTLPASLASK